MYNERIRSLQVKLREQEWDGAVICQNVDLFYFTGSMQSGFLYVPANGEAIYWVRRSFSRAKTESFVAVREFAGLPDMANAIGGDGRRKLILALEFDVLPVQLYMRIQKAFSGTEWRDGSALIRELRMLKSADEIQWIREAAAVVDRVFMQTVGLIHEGMSELELLMELEQGLRRNGHLGPMRLRGFNQEIYNGLVGFGAGASTPTYFDGPAGGQGLSPAFPQSAGQRKLVAGEPILIDLGCNVGGYIIDQTRTVVIGELSETLFSAYQLAEQILFALEQQLRPGSICADLYSAAVERAEQAGLGMHFMGYGADRVKFIGHGIGLEVDEWPVVAGNVKMALQPGMVIALEPKFSFPGQGVVGIEDSYLITDSGFERLTRTAQRCLMKAGN